jgi:hypothetical protein
MNIAWPIVEVDVFATTFACNDVAREHEEKLAVLLFALRAALKYLPS